MTTPTIAKAPSRITTIVGTGPTELVPTLR